VRILARPALEAFWLQHVDARAPLQEWYDEVRRAQWHSPHDIKAMYASASFVGNNRVVFNIKGNSYRLIVAVAYAFQLVFIKFIGTHAQYEQLDAATVEYKP